jgi:hypothetical protein
MNDNIEFPEIFQDLFAHTTQPKWLALTKEGLENIDLMSNYRWCMDLKVQCVNV